MKVTVESKKGLNKDIKVIIDKKTIKVNDIINSGIKNNKITIFCTTKTIKNINITN